MSVETVERKLWTCNACGDEQITTGDKPKDWVTLWAWATRYVVRDRPDKPKVCDIAIHTCHECSSGKMHFIVRRLIKHLTDDEHREFKGERCKSHPECARPDKHEGGHRVLHSRVVPTSDSMIVHRTDAKPPPLHGSPVACSNPECVMPEHEDVIHTNADGNEFEWPEVDRNGKPYDDYPGVLSLDSDNDPLEVQDDHPDSCMAEKKAAPIADVVHCHRCRDHDGDHHDAFHDVKWK